MQIRIDAPITEMKHKFARYALLGIEIPEGDSWPRNSLTEGL